MNHNTQTHLERLKETSPKVFDQPDYDALLVVTKTLFGESSVSTDIEHFLIDISDKIHLRISLSYNECKAYFYSYIIPKEYDFPTQADIRSAFMNVNKPFRLFTLTDMVNFLGRKALENDFIRQIEG